MISRPTRSGFTLAEITIGIGIFGTFVLLAMVFALGGIRNYQLTQTQTTQLDQARIGLETIVKELREIQPADNGAYPIAQATGTSLTVYANVVGSGSRERVRYFLQGTDLRRGVTKASGTPPQYLNQNEIVKTVIQNVRNTSPVFTYYDGNFTGSEPPLASPVNLNAVRLVLVALTVDVDPNKPPAPVTLQSYVNLRNLKDNL